jgi:hypothetical protein
LSSNKKAFHNSTVNNTNNNSISSLNAPKNFYMSAKNNLFNKKIPMFKPKTSLKKYDIGEKIYIYQKKNDSKKYTNSIGQHFPIDLLSKNNNQYNNLLKSNNNNHIKYNGNNNINKNVNTSINKKNIKSSKNNNVSKGNYIYNNINFNNSHIIKANNKNNSRQINNNSHIAFINNSISHNNKKNANPINTYFINTLNVSEKDFLNSGISTGQGKKPQQKNDYENEINKLIKEKEESENTIKKQEKLIEKLIEDNEKLENKIKSIENENNKISQKISSHEENQEQLIMLVKIIQKSGVDVEELIDKWNNEVELENEENDGGVQNYSNNESYTDSINELNDKIDPSSFIPINIEEPRVNQKVFSGVPKLNFDAIKNNNNREGNRKKFRNNSK